MIQKRSLALSVLILILVAGGVSACAGAAVTSRPRQTSGGAAAPPETMTELAQATLPGLPTQGVLASQGPAGEPGTPSPAPPVTATGENPVMNEARRMNLEWPTKIRLGDSDRVRMNLDVDSEGNLTPTVMDARHATHIEPIKVPNIYDSYNILAEARLDIAGMQVSPEGDVREPMRPGRSVTFLWTIRPDAIGNYDGTIWLHLVFVPLKSDRANEISTDRIPVATQPITIQVVNFLGLGGMPARVVGGIGTLLGSVLGLDNIIPWLWKRTRKNR